MPFPQRWDVDRVGRTTGAKDGSNLLEKDDCLALSRLLEGTDFGVPSHKREDMRRNGVRHGVQKQIRPHGQQRRCGNAHRGGMPR